MTDYDSFSAAEFADLLSTKLREFYDSSGPATTPFFYFDGQDPFAFTTPSGAMARFFKDLNEAARPNFVRGVLDLIGSRADGLSAAALEQMVFLIGSLQNRSLLHPLVKRLGMVAADLEAPRPLFVSALMVLKGFGYQSEVVEAAKRLTEFMGFPDDLLCEVFQLRIAEDETRWSGVFREYLPGIERDRTPSTSQRVHKRLAHLARWLASHVSLSELQAGLDDLLSVDAEQLRRMPLEERRDVIGLLACELKRARSQLRLLQAASQPAESEEGNTIPELAFTEP